MRKFLVMIALVLPLTVLACTNFLVGKEASADGSTIISYAADSYGMFGFLHFSPAADYPEGAMREVKDWDTGRSQGTIPQVAHTYSVVGNMNEHQVTIGETTWGGREALWDTVGVDYGSLIYIALERSKTAREAIDWMITLVNEYGYASEGESFSIGDPNEIWIMDLIGKGPGKKGANWVAVRIPDNAISAHANQARITTLPVNMKVKMSAKQAKQQKLIEKKLNCVCKGDWMWDKDLIAFAREKGYFSGKDEEFSFQAAYNPFDFSGLYVCEARVWSFFRHFSDEMDQYLDYATGKTFRENPSKENYFDLIDCLCRSRVFIPIGDDKNILFLIEDEKVYVPIFDNISYIEKDSTCYGAIEYEFDEVASFIVENKLSVDGILLNYLDSANTVEFPTDLIIDMKANIEKGIYSVNMDIIIRGYEILDNSIDDNLVALSYSLSKDPHEIKDLIGKDLFAYLDKNYKEMNFEPGMIGEFDYSNGNYIVCYKKHIVSIINNEIHCNNQEILREKANKIYKLMQ